MGYESKLYVVQKHDAIECPWYDVIATFDLCKMGWDVYDGKTFRQLFTLPQDGYLFADDGNTNIHEDAYGDPVEGTLIDDVIHWLGQFCENHDYNRANVFLALLRSVQREFGNNDMLCFHYGN